jgi:glutamyl/glutaminyl-tRNA synthetase
MRFQKLLDNDVVPKFAEWLALPKALRRQKAEEDAFYPQTQKEFAEYHSITEQTLCNWKKDKRVQRLKTKFQKEYAGDSMPEVIQTLKQRAVEGDTQSIKLYMQYLGELTEKTQITMTSEKVDSLLEKIIEIIQKHISDPHILNMIAKDVAELTDDE